MICGGVDAGSRTIKAVLWDSRPGVVLGSGLVDQGVQQSRLARELFDRVRAQAGLDGRPVGPIVATGYARHTVDFAATTITEITCHAAGVHHLLGEARTVVEIGGQDSKLLRLGERGTVRDFAMNDRCAAGTGRFLEAVAARLGVGMEALGELACASHSPATISSMCVVFAETEIIGLLAGGTLPADIVAGVQNAIATRVAAMAGQGLDAPVAFTGGVALVGGMPQAISQALRMPVVVPPGPRMTGALGAAILASRLATAPAAR